ncbi:MAG: YqjF family protein, partial [Gemmatimonadales bacterium]
LEPLLPSGTELDRWRDRLLVSLVGFRFLHTRVFGIPVPMHRDFTEVNLRFYVRARGPEGWRRGVVFIREIVPRMAIALVARAVYNEPYRALPMRHSIEIGSDGGRAHYEWDLGGRWHGVSAVTNGPCEPLAEGSEAQFVAEHYWGYTRQRDGATVEYQVRHPSWRAWRATGSVHGDPALTYGPAFGEVLRGPPVSAYLAEGSAVEVVAPRRLPATGRLHR